jgi:hypothetical protein
MSLKQRIKEAYLSDKNIESVNELLHEVAVSNANIEIGTMYTPDVVISFLRDMMEYIINESDRKLDDPNFIVYPKKTIILLNYIAIKKTMLQLVANKRANQLKQTQHPFQNKTDTNNFSGLSKQLPSTHLKQPLKPSIPPRSLPTSSKPIHSLQLQRKSFKSSPSHIQKFPQRALLSNTHSLPVGSISIDELFPKKKKLKNAVSIKSLDKQNQQQPF